MSPTSTSRRCRATEYWRDGALVPLDIRTETIKVAGGEDVRARDPLDRARPDRVGPDRGIHRHRGRPLPLRRRRPVAAPDDALEGDYAVSLRWTALEPGTTAQAIFQLNLAQGFDDFRAAAELFDVPAQNLIYADVDGNIGYQTPGKLPIRGAGDGWMPQPGWDSAYDWQGFIPFAELPTSYNPDSGLHRHGEQRDRRRALSVLPLARLGPRLPRRPHRRHDRAEGRRRPADGGRHARDPGRQRVLDGQAARVGADGCRRPRCRPRRRRSS